MIAGPKRERAERSRVAADGGRRLVHAGARDIRSRRLYLFSRRAVAGVVRRSASVLTLVALDVCGLALALYVALALRELYVGHTPLLWGLLWRAETSWLPFLTLVTVLVFWRAGLYAEREERTRFGRILSSLAIVAVLTVAFALGTGYRFSTFGIVPTTLILSAVFIGLLRASYESATRELLSLAGVRRRALLVGDGDDLERLRQRLGRDRGSVAYEFVGTVTRERRRNGSALGTISDLPTLLRLRPVDELVVARADLGEEELVEIVDHAHRHGVRVRVAATTADILAQRARFLPGEGVPLFEMRPPVFAGADWAIKRTFDLIVASALVVIGFPFWVTIAALVKAGSAGPIFYRDPRVGVGEREFSMFKFRTMYVDAAERQAELESANQADGPLFKLRDDPRVTRVGAFLRRYSLDEVPQVLNVLRGEMSLVGPRPLPLRDYRRLESWHRKRYLVLPGMTGLWQISGRSNLGFDDLVRLDFFYLDNWSIWLDVAILLKTPLAVIARRGAY